jgi:hypothetical protein
MKIKSKLLSRETHSNTGIITSFSFHNSRKIVFSGCVTIVGAESMNVIVNFVKSV